MRPAFAAWRGLLFAFNDTQLIPGRSFRLAYVPTCIREREWNSPKMFSSHKTTAITTTAFKMDLIVPCIGMKLLTSQSRTPITTRTTSI
jgi:hypothetical protein